MKFCGELMLRSTCGLGGEVDHRIKGVLGHERIHLVGIGNIGLEKLVAFAVLLRDAVEIGEVARRMSGHPRC